LSLSPSDRVVRYIFRMKTKEIKSMHDEIMEEDWVTGGPLMELSVMSAITRPIAWHWKVADGERVYPEISDEDIELNKKNYTKKIIQKLRASFPEITILPDDERINNELDSSSYLSLDMKAIVHIGGERQARINIGLIANQVFKFSLDELLINVGDRRSYGIEDVAWNPEVLAYED